MRHNVAVIAILNIISKVILTCLDGTKTIDMPLLTLDVVEGRNLDTCTTSRCDYAK